MTEKHVQIEMQRIASAVLASRIDQSVSDNNFRQFAYECALQAATIADAALRKQVEELRRDAIAMRKGLINWRTKAWPGTDQVSVVDRDFPTAAAMAKEK